MRAVNPEIVAELSANHLGSLARAMKLIDAAKEAGADAVKLQCWHPQRMTSGQWIIDGGLWDGYPLHQLYAEAWVPWNWFQTLWDHARALDVGIFSSVFDVEALEFLEGLGCPRHKIASFEITDLPLIRAVANTGKPVVISTGMATREEIADACHAARNAPDLTVLKCTSSYPAPVSETNIAAMNALPRICPWAYKGLSDHTLGLAVPVAATVLGATMIEKHLTLARADGGPDAGFSSEPHEFKAMVDACREAAQALGTVTYGPTEAEKPSLIYRRSWYAKARLLAGTILIKPVIEHCLQTSRPALGLPANYALEGRTLARDVSAGSPLTEDDLAG